MLLFVDYDDENQVITEYTMRILNERFLNPDIVILCNIRQDHNGTLGSDRQRIARSFGRSIPRVHKSSTANNTR